MDSGTRQFLLQQLMWIGISFGISIGISLVVPFPFSLPIIIFVFIALSYYMRKRQLGAGSGRGLFNPMPRYGSGSVDYYCISCGTKHNQAACPRCGSRMKKAGF
jgi:hypothetical protein